MSELKILHNPRCSKSREALKYLENANLNFEVIEYLNTPLSEHELLSLLNQLKDSSAKDLVRTKDDKYKETKFDVTSDTQVAKYLALYPQLMERPVIIYKDEAVIARPIEKLHWLLNQKK